jgi:hypothetical protein
MAARLGDHRLPLLKPGHACGAGAASSEAWGELLARTRGGSLASGRGTPVSNLVLQLLRRHY